MMYLDLYLKDIEYRVHDIKIHSIEYSFHYIMKHNTESSDIRSIHSSIDIEVHRGLNVSLINVHLNLSNELNRTPVRSNHSIASTSLLVFYLS